MDFKPTLESLGRNLLAYHPPQFDCQTQLDYQPRLAPNFDIKPRKDNKVSPTNPILTYLYDESIKSEYKYSTYELEIEAYIQIKPFKDNDYNMLSYVKEKSFKMFVNLEDERLSSLDYVKTSFIEEFIPKYAQVLIKSYQLSNQGDGSIIGNGSVKIVLLYVELDEIPEEGLILDLRTNIASIKMLECYDNQVTILSESDDEIMDENSLLQLIKDGNIKMIQKR
ncbi:Hypothetical protein ORPV_162 [Orpheovirus IHUMI-LCC2]|uniref:Uncharacterized protein n=1 Tax=Orpheovirus IHUMI-LCC2 TaxID=2023057 RepID=A0A2I2L3G2_9VIRU|nr:Hypothetical protein ORPV_162 [Orpheovirus IHUMI-LCC2]SNW62066.1 Hypothetical protein ORPV_162 [Orpheovirus IHUMI-LCC2]